MALSADIGFSGNGHIIGDPHYRGADGTNYDVQGAAGQFYNQLTDTSARLVVNARFDRWQNSDSATVVGQLGITYNGQRIMIDKGELTINSGRVLGDGTYMNGAVVKDGDTITFTTPKYTLVIHDRGDYLDTYLTATNAMTHYDAATDTETDRERLGLWGQSLVIDNDEAIDTNYFDFQVSGLFKSGGSRGSSDLSGINTDFAAPVLGGKPSTRDSLNFQKAMFEYAIAVSAAQTGMTTVGNLQKKSGGTTPQ